MEYVITEQGMRRPYEAEETNGVSIVTIAMLWSNTVRFFTSAIRNSWV